jgi:hypothetical protein
MSEDFADTMAKLREARLRREREEGAGVSAPSDSQPDEFFARIRGHNIVAAYRRFFPGKKVESKGGATLGQCPNTDYHQNGDRHPGLQLYQPGQGEGFFCHACRISGTVIDLAAISYGMADNWRCPRHLAGDVAARATTDLLGIEVEKVGDGFWRDVPLTVDPVLEQWARESVDPSGPGTVVVSEAGAAPQVAVVAQPERPKSRGTRKPAVEEPEPEPQPEPQPEPEPEPEPEPVPAPAAEPAGVGDFFADPAPVLAKPGTVHSQVDLAGLYEAASNYTPLAPRERRANEPEIPEIDHRSIIGPRSVFLRPYMKHVESHFGAPQWHLWCAMMAVGTAVGKNAYTNGTPIYGNLMLCLVGSVSGGKSRSFDVVSQIVREAFPVDPYEPDSDGVNMVGNGASGPALLDTFKHKVTITAPVPDKSSPPDSEGNFPPKLDKSGNPVFQEIELEGTRLRVLADYDEISTLKAKSSSESSTLMQMVMQAYDGNRVGNFTRMHGNEIVRDPFFSMVTTAQTERLAELIGKDTIFSGFASRMCFVYGTERNPASEDEVDFSNAPQHLVDALRDIDSWVRTLPEKRLRFDPNSQARTLWDGFFAQLGRDKALSVNTTEQNLIARSQHLARKILLILTADCMERYISEETVLRAVMLWRYVDSCTKLMTRKLLATVAGEAENETLAAIKEHIRASGGPGPTIRDLKRKLHAREWSRELPMIVDSLLKQQEIIEVQQTAGAKGGRPTKRLVINKD